MNSIADILPAGATLPRHRHAHPYVTLVLSGSYVEAGDHGRFKVGPGDVLLHGRFAAHANWISSQSDVRTLNIEVGDAPVAAALAYTSRFDEIVGLSYSDLPAAKETLLSSLAPKSEFVIDWPDILAKAIRDDPGKPIGHWCHWLGLAPATVSRRFKTAYGVSPAQYRATARTRRAYDELLKTDIGLAELANQFNFSDQAHLTRSISALTGAPPSVWRKVKYLQDGKSLPK